MGGLKDGLVLIGYAFMKVYILLFGDPLNSYLLKALFRVDRHKKKLDLSTDETFLHIR